MFISKKAYKELRESRDHWKELAQETMKQNKELIEQVADLLNVCQDLNSENRALQFQHDIIPSWL